MHLYHPQVLQVDKHKNIYIFLNYTSSCIIIERQCLSLCRINISSTSESGSSDPIFVVIKDITGTWHATVIFVILNILIYFSEV